MTGMSPGKSNANVEKPAQYLALVADKVLS